MQSKTQCSCALSKNLDQQMNGETATHNYNKVMGINRRGGFSNLSVHQNHLAGLLKQGLLGPTSGVADSVGLG